MIGDETEGDGETRAIAWVNTLSACELVTESDLLAFVKSAPSLPVYSTVAGGRHIGRVLRAEVRDGVDLWTEIEIEPSASFERAAGVLGQTADGSIRLLAVMVTNLPRELIRKLSDERRP